MSLRGSKIFRMVTIVVTVFTFLSVTTYADMGSYMGNILSQLGELTPKVYHTQQRGYFVGGTVHIPPLGQTIHPFEISLPTWKNNSCGGIDILGGGFSYLNFDYIVQSLQNIIQAAPALAFEIALRVLSEQLFGSSNTLQSIIDALNGLNFNSCTAMNGIVTTASNLINQAIKGSGQQAVKEQENGGSNNFADAISSFIDNVWPSLKETFNDIKNAVKNKNPSTSDTEAQEVAGIPAGGLLNAVSQELGGLPSDFVDTMRYYLGDVSGEVVPVKDSAGAPIPTPMAVILWPCGPTATAKGFVDDLVNGEIHEISFDELSHSPGTCAGQKIEAGAGASLKDKITKYMQDIYQALVENEDLSTFGDSQQIVNLIEISPIPIYSFLRNSALIGGGYGDVLIEQLAKPVAIAIASEVAGQYIRALMSAISHVKGRMEIKGTSQALKTIDAYIQHLIQFQSKLQDQYYLAMKAANQIYSSFLERYKLTQNLVNEKLTSLNMQQSLAFQRSLGW